MDTIFDNIFCNCKPNLVTSLLLLRYECSRSTFLKKDWSTGEMDYILMHSDESLYSLAVIKHLAATGDCLFDVSLDSPRLKHVLFWSRASMSYERDHHSVDRHITYG